ncbi:MAG: PepSY-associated TM helix domain-containing protein [Sphingomonadales bacterium]
MTTKAASAGRARKNFWLKQLHTWHWISSAVSLIGLLLFTITGFTLNHAGEIGATPETATKAAQLPAALLVPLSPGGTDDGKRALPAPVADWIASRFPTEAKGEAEWSADEVYLPLPRPGGDGWISIDRATGAVTSEITDRGWISYLNDLHKGRNSGAVWKWFIDVFAFASLVFALTGLVLLWIHSKRRRSTWPLVTLGLAIPATIAVLFIHV